MDSHHIRELFLKFFESKGHTRVESSSLVPHTDPSLLFTNAGMVQFKDTFLGKEKRDYLRATSSQKCLRAGGKHNDLENVGFTARHHTFFEMLGNFSFGDYFKQEAIAYAWEFSTQVLKLPQEKLYVTVFEADHEAYRIWNEIQKVPTQKIFRFGEKDNFWSMGETGPCGPCSELFIDRGPETGCLKPTCSMGCDCDRFLEFWNLVFMQFNRLSDGSQVALPRPSVDTGAGLERLSMILQGVSSNYETDLFKNLILGIEKKAPKNQDASKIFSLQVLADHLRAITFLMADGVLPSAEGRGYVLRRIIRRAIRYGKKMGFHAPFLHELIDLIVHQMQGPYPYLKNEAQRIQKLLFLEEEQFFKTLERGLALLDDYASEIKEILPGDKAFKLYDTYGFPLDLTRVILKEKGLSVDEAGFDQAMERQKSESRKNWKGSGDNEPILRAYFELDQQLKAQGHSLSFSGYEKLVQPSKCVGLLVQNPKTEGLEQVITSKGYQKVQAIFLETPFYAESGGQIGDRGVIEKASSFKAKVIDTQKPLPGLHILFLEIEKGELSVGDLCDQRVDHEARNGASRNHTATHLLHSALRGLLGDQLKQASSLVAPDYLRFEFNHPKPLTKDELQKIEDLVNEQIWKNSPVNHRVMKKKDALEKGVLAFFGEKYGDEVRVIESGEHSTEFCGGTHVHSCGEIHLFKILSESSRAAGIRRIVAVTSQEAFKSLRDSEERLKEIQKTMEVSSSQEIISQLQKLRDEKEALKVEMGQIKSKMIREEANLLFQKAQHLSGAACLLTELASDQGFKKMKQLADLFHEKSPESFVLFGMKDPQDELPLLYLSRSKKCPPIIDCGKILKEILPMIEGKGGGKSEAAQAKGKGKADFTRVFEAVFKLLQNLEKT